MGALVKNLDLAGHVIMPGLINAHDHLEFNLFPRLGHGPYNNATEWARDIYHPDRSPIREHLRVPKPARLWWGALKNLLSGVTTVCHHNPYEPAVFNRDFPVKVVRRFSWAHSLAFEPDLAARYRRAPSRPFLLHCGEGTDAAASREFEELDSMGALSSRTALIHGVALKASSLALLRRRRTSLIWCPTSNLTMLGRTLSRSILRSGIPIALATDSALSAPVDLLDELAVARRYLPAARLYRMVTTAPAKILRLLPSKGDWIAVRTPAKSAAEALLTGTISLVVSRGRIRLISPDLAAQLPPPERKRFQPLAVEGRPAVLVAADMRALLRAVRPLGPGFCLAGKRVFA
jgi:cytosine/adenosine deaminase-related metal-dependent hydrolase